MNIYGQDTTEPMEQATGLFASKLQGRMKSFFGTSRQSELAMARKYRITGDLLRGAIRTFGMKNLMLGEKFHDDATKQITEQLKDLRTESTRARKTNDMEAYQGALRRRTLLDQMRASAQMAKEARVGQIFTAIAMAFAEIFGIQLAQWQNPEITSAGYTAPSYSYDPRKVPQMQW